MTRRFSLLISRICITTIILVPLIALYLLWNIDSFAEISRDNINLPIHWHTVVKWQWYSLWLLVVLYLSISLVGLYFLHRPFANFAKGELFNLANSHDIRFFAILLFAQAFAKPLLFALSSVLLSLNHPANEKMLSVSFGSGELTSIVLAMILWVISNLLVEANKLQSENQQFI